MPDKRRGVNVLTLMLLFLWSSTAAAQGAKLYELTENMKLVSKGQPRRTATSQLMGFAQVGTPLCPDVSAQVVIPQGTVECTINATGSDNVNYATGLGSLQGRFTVVIQGDNPVDGPEQVVMRGNFRGKMDFSPALLRNLPYGTVVGNLTSDHGAKIPFAGTFRLPFLASYSGPETSGKTLRELFCPLTPSPNTNLLGVDVAYIDTTAGAPNGRCIDVMANELSLGFPTVRFDISFP